MANTYYKLIIYDNNGREIHFVGGNDIYNSQKEAIDWADENGYDNYKIKPIVTYNHYTVYYEMTAKGYIPATHPKMNIHILKSESDRLIESTVGVDNSISRIKVCFTNENLDIADNEAIDAYARKILDDYFANNTTDKWIKRVVEKLRVWLRDNNMTCREFAEKMKVSETTVSRWLNGSRTPRPATALDIENYIEYGKEAEAVYGKIRKEFKEDLQKLTKMITRKQYEDLGSFDLSGDALVYEMNYKSKHKEEETTVSYFTSDDMYHVLKRIK